MCTVNWFDVHVYLKLVWGQDRDIQEYHTDGTLHMIGNVQGQTIECIHIIENFTTGHFGHMDTQTHRQSQIVAY